MSLLFKKCYFPLVSWSTKSISVNESIDFSLMCCNKKYLSMFSVVDSWDAMLDSVPAMMWGFSLFFMHEVVKSALFQNRINDLGSAGSQLSHLTVQKPSMDSHWVSQDPDGALSGRQWGSSQTELLTLLPLAEVVNTDRGPPCLEELLIACVFLLHHTRNKMPHWSCTLTYPGVI